MGGSVAYHLAKLGIKPIILERESIGCEASGVATGMISVMSIDSPGPYLDLAKFSFEKYKTLIPEMEDASGVNTFYGGITWLDLAFDEDDEEHNRQTMEWRKTLMPRVTWAQPEDLPKIDPRITPEALAASTLKTSIRPTLSPHLPYIGAAESLGVEVRYTDVTGLQKDGDRVTGVFTPDGVVPCDAVVLAMGAWTADASDWIGTPIPVRPYKGQMLELQAPGPPLGANIHHGRSYVTSKLNGTHPLRQLRRLPRLRQVRFSGGHPARSGRRSQSLSGHGRGAHHLAHHRPPPRHPRRSAHHRPRARP